MKNKISEIQNVLPIGTLEPIENDELIIAQLKHESENNQKQELYAPGRRLKNGRKK